MPCGSMGDEVLVSVPLAMWMVGVGGWGVCLVQWLWWVVDAGWIVGLWGMFCMACLVTMVFSIAVRGEMQRDGLVGLVGVTMLQDEDDGARGGERICHF